MAADGSVAPLSISRNHSTGGDSFPESRGCRDDRLLPDLAQAEQKDAAFRARPRRRPEIEGPYR